MEKQRRSAGRKSNRLGAEHAPKLALLGQLGLGGHTDNVGSPQKNQPLSEERARSVFDYLRAKVAGFDSLGWTAKGYGSGAPIAPNTTALGKAKNRRTLLTDRNKAWNPFGMFVLEWGLDGLLYLSVGNHSVDIGGPTNIPPDAVDEPLAA